MSENKMSSGIGLTRVATFLVFLMLKLTHVIAWSWWWITAPLWGGLALLAGFLAVALPVAITWDAINRRRNRKRRAQLIEEYLRKLEGGRP